MIAQIQLQSVTWGYSKPVYLYVVAQRLYCTFQMQASHAAWLCTTMTCENSVFNPASLISGLSRNFKLIFKLNFIITTGSLNISVSSPPNHLSLRLNNSHFIILSATVLAFSSTFITLVALCCTFSILFTSVFHSHDQNGTFYSKFGLPPQGLIKQICNFTGFVTDIPLS